MNVNIVFDVRLSCYNNIPPNNYKTSINNFSS